MLKSDPTMRALLWLAEYGKEVDYYGAEYADGAIDFGRIVQLMQDVLNIHLVFAVNILTHSYVLFVIDSPRKRIRNNNRICPQSR